MTIVVLLYNLTELLAVVVVLVTFLIELVKNGKYNSDVISGVKNFPQNNLAE